MGTIAGSSVMIGRFTAGLFALVVLAAAAVAVRPSVGVTRAEPTESGVPTRAPAPVTAFMNAYAHGDLATAERVASPLYRAEWTRRGLSLRDRTALLPAWLKATGHSAVWLRFTYLGGVFDARGFGHLLYTAVATGGDGAAGPTVWRVDTDADGRVVWSELVYLFTETRSAAPSLTAVRDRAAVELPRGLAVFQPRVLLGVRAIPGREGYYAVGLYAAPGDGARATVRPARIVFFALDEDGNVRPGVWSYGQNPTLVEYGRVTPVPTVDLPPDQAGQLSAYLGTLP